MKKPGEMALIGLMLMFFLLIAIYVFNFAFDAKNLPDFAKRNEEAINLAVITVAGFSVLLMIIGVFGLFFRNIVIPQLLSMPSEKVKNATKGVLPIYKYLGTSQQYLAISALLNTQKIERE